MDGNLRRVTLAGGAAAGQPVVLCVPGAMCPPDVFEAMAVASGRHVVGLAWLEGAGPHDLPPVARRVAAVAAEYPAVLLVGHSIGTPIAVLAASLSAARGGSTIRGLVLSNSGANTKGHGDIDSIIRTVGQQWGEPLWRAFVARCLGSPVAPALLERMHGYPPQLTAAAVVAALTSQKDVDLLPILGALGHLPAAMVHGRHDAARTLAHAEEIVGGWPGATLHVLETGHSSAAEAPHAFAAILNQVIDRCRLR